MSSMKKKNTRIQEEYHTAAKDNMSIKLTQAKALLLIGSDVDFSSYDPSVQQDYFGAALQYVEDASDIMDASEDSMK